MVESRTQRAVFVAIAIAIVVVAVIVLAGGDSANPTNGGRSSLITLDSSGGIEVVRVSKGDRVKLAVESDRSDQVHIHGYDLRAPVSPEMAAHFSFAATIEGEFVIELEGAKRQVAALRVRP